MFTEQQGQRISKLMDGEAGRFEATAAIGDLTQSPELAETWERWHLIGRGLRRERISSEARQTSARVRAALAAEAPTGDASRNPKKTHFSRPFGALIAAGIAALGIAVVLTQPAEDPRASPELFSDAAIQSAPPRWQQPDPALRERLDRLLMGHHEKAPGLVGTGVAAYVAVVGYERRP